MANGCARRSSDEDTGRPGKGRHYLSVGNCSGGWATGEAAIGLAEFWPLDCRSLFDAARAASILSRRSSSRQAQRRPTKRRGHPKGRTQWSSRGSRLDRIGAPWGKMGSGEPKPAEKPRTEPNQKPTRKPKQQPEPQNSGRIILLEPQFPPHQNRRSKTSFKPVRNNEPKPRTSQRTQTKEKRRPPGMGTAATHTLEMVS
jgi:hypothetical protein